MKDRLTIKNKMTVVEFATRVNAVAYWLPLLGGDAYALYSLYLCLDSLNLELGIRKIGEMLDLSRTSVLRLNRFLAMCGLVEIIPGTPTSPNEVHLLDPVEMTPDLLSELWARLFNDPVLSGTGGNMVRKQIIGRLENYKSLYDHLPNLLMAQLPAPAHSPSVNGNSNGYHSPVREQAQPEVQKSREILEKFGVSGVKLAQLSRHDPAYVLGWCLMASNQKGLNNPPAYVVKRLEEEAKLPVNMVDLCQTLVIMPTPDFEVLQYALYRFKGIGDWGIDDEDFYPELNESHLLLFKDIYCDFLVGLFME